MDKSRFCITGLPRSRTAWLAALMCAHGVETLHEYPPFFDSLEELGKWLYAGTPAEPHGYVDGFSLIYHAPLVKQHFADSPIVLIVRDPKDVRRSWEAWDGPVDNEVFAAVMSRVTRFATEAVGQPHVLVVRYDQLEHYAPVNRLVMHCTDRPLKFRTWQLFHRLKIELHKDKCQPRVGDARAILRRSPQ
jgi:hypothetical protein